MPSSATPHLPFVIDALVKLNPSSMLDIGIGFGKWGYIMREFVGARRGECRPPFGLRITGVEAWCYPDTLPWIRHIYNEIVQGDILNVVGDLEEHDVVTIMDCFEHITREQGEELLPKLVALATKAFIISLPAGADCVLRNKLMDGNPYDQHKACWQHKEIIQKLEAFGGRVEHFHGHSPLGGVSAFILYK